MWKSGIKAPKKNILMKLSNNVIAETYNMEDYWQNQFIANLENNAIPKDILEWIFLTMRNF